jgi:integrase
MANFDGWGQLSAETNSSSGPDHQERQAAVSADLRRHGGRVGHVAHQNQGLGLSVLDSRRGQPVFDFEKASATACELAGAPHALFHDLRRTALSNMIDAGLSEKEAMEISGHKTRAVFDRYHIVSARKMRQNAEKLEAHSKAKESSETQATVTDGGDRQPGRVN